MFWSQTNKGALSRWSRFPRGVPCVLLHCLHNIYSARRIGERSVIMSMSVFDRLCVCLSAIISLEPHVRSSPNFLCMLPMAVALSSSGNVMICYVLPVLWMTSYLLISQGCSTSSPSRSAVHTQPWAWLCAVIPVAGQRTHGTTFRALEVTSQVATPEVEYAFCDCTVCSCGGCKWLSFLTLFPWWHAISSVSLSFTARNMNSLFLMVSAILGFGRNGIFLFSFFFLCVDNKQLSKSSDCYRTCTALFSYSINCLIYHALNLRFLILYEH